MSFASRVLSNSQFILFYFNQRCNSNLMQRIFFPCKLRSLSFVRIIENRMQCYYINFSLYLYKHKIIIMHRDLTEYFTVLNKSKEKIPLQWLQKFHKRFFSFSKETWLKELSIEPYASQTFSITISNVYRKASSIITNVLVDLHINFRFSGVNRTRKCSCSILLSLLLWQVNLIIPKL